jgi:hypothetical protein
MVSRRRIAAVAAGLAAFAIAAGALTQVGHGGPDRVRIGTGAVSALTRAARPTDALPAYVLALPFAAHNFASTDGRGSRIVAVDGTTQIFAVPGQGRSLCVVEVDQAAETAGGACADRSVLLTGSIWTAEVAQDGTKDVVGLVGDGHSYVAADERRVPVANNAFVIHNVRGEEVQLGSSTATQTVSLTR